MINLGQNLRFVKKSLETPAIAEFFTRLRGRQSALGIRQDIDLIAIPIRPLDREVFLNGRTGLQGFMHGFVGDAESARAQHRLDSVLMQTITDRQGIGFLDHGILVVVSVSAS